MHSLNNLALLIGRILIVGIFVYDGVIILKNPEQVAGYMTAFGVPGDLWPLVVACQLIGSALILLGWHARLAALGFTAFCFATAFIFHANFGDAGEILHFGKDLALAGGFLILAASGPGDWSMSGARDG